MPSDFLVDLIDHKRRVGLYLQKVANALFQRAVIHDNSKFSPEEYEPYEEAFPGLQKYAYGTDEFKAELRKIKPAIQHHYGHNDHHPEYFKSGIEGMNLIQLVEMICDWIAASERSGTNIHKGLLMNKERFGIDDQLFGVIERTVIELTGRINGPDPNTLYPDMLLTGPFPEKHKQELNETDLIEKLADAEHASWARWMQYLFSKCTQNPDGSLAIPLSLGLRWTRQAGTDYADLPESEKQSDRDEVEHILPIIEAYKASSD